MKLILDFGVSLRIEIMLIRFQCFPPALPTHIFNQLPQPALRLCL